MLKYPGEMSTEREAVMASHQIINRGRGPELAGTRFTVFDVLPYRQQGRSSAYIAAICGLSVVQVETLLQYITEHEAEVLALNQPIAERIARGNPPELAAKLQTMRGTARARRAELLRQRQQEANGAGHPE